MLNNKDAIANLAVKDVAKAKKFYRETLGLEPAQEVGDEVVVFKSGNSSVIVYKSQYAGTNQATALTWTIGDGLEKEVETLKTKGVKFEHYDLPNTERKGDIHVCGDTRMAWFKDPDGNILALISN